MHKGIAASDGIGIGNICVIADRELNFEKKIITDKASERARFNKAVAAFQEETAFMAEDIRKRLGSKEAQILEGHIALTNDPSLTDEICRLIDTGQCAEAAVSSVCDIFINLFSGMNDDLMRQRAADIVDVRTGLLTKLLGIDDSDTCNVPPDTVLVSRELTPSMTSRINKENVVAIITETGGQTSHSAILARALEIPAVLSVNDITSLVKGGDKAIVDGTQGLIIVNPDKDMLSDYERRKQALALQKTELQDFADKKTETADGLSLNLYCNIGSSKELEKVLECGGEGIGLFRSEFLFMDRNGIPSEEEQFDAYREAAVAMKGKPVVIRTLDIGGDKEISFLNMKKEKNPFLGFRAIRYSLGYRDFYKTQLRAILRASAFGKVKILVPFITCVDELRAVRELIAELAQELNAVNTTYDKNIEIGCMIETPAASIIADILAKEADFFSIGTNDLTQYIMSADRGNADVAYLYSPLQPAVLRSIKHIIKCGQKAGIPVEMCGDAASDPLMLPLLLSFGLTGFSVYPSQVLAVRSLISKWSVQSANELTDKVMNMTTYDEIVATLKASV